MVSGDIHLLAVDGIILFLNHTSDYPIICHTYNADLPNYCLVYNILLVYGNYNITLVFITWIL